MSRAPQERADSVYRTRAVFINAVLLGNARKRLRGSLDRLGRIFRIVAVGQSKAEATSDVAGITQYARSHSLEIYASWYVGNAPALDFQGVLAGDDAESVEHALATIEKTEAHSRILTGTTRLDGLVASLRAARTRIVFTNGVFDLLHIGHLRLLDKARQLGDILFVGINSDDSTRKIKGESRPVVPQFARAETIVALRAVDYCCIFTEADPRHVLAIVRPDVLVKGCDYPLSRVVGAEFVRGYGGSVVRLPLVDGCSTTSLIRRINERKVRA